MKDAAHDDSGWTANCRHCGVPIWVAWRAHDGTYKRFDIDRLTLHHCEHHCEETT